MVSRSISARRRKNNKSSRRQRGGANEPVAIIPGITQSMSIEEAAKIILGLLPMTTSAPTTTAARTTTSAPTTTAASTTTATAKELVINCSLGSDNKVVINSPPTGITIGSTGTNVNILTFNTTKSIADIRFSGPNGPVNPRYLGIGTGISIESASIKRVPKDFTSIITISPSQKRLDSTSPITGEIIIRNLNTSNLGLSATNRNFTITLTTL